MRQYRISPAAEQDMDEIISYIAQDNPTAVLKLLNGFYEAMDRLAVYPQLVQYRPDLTPHPVRF